MKHLLRFLFGCRILDDRQNGQRSKEKKDGKKQTRSRKGIPEEEVP